MNRIFRFIRADEIQVRPTNTNYKGKATLLLYKDARVDANILDETFTPYGWASNYKTLDGVTYCGVALRDKDTDTWIWKWDSGSNENNFEAEKATASDAFKRACFKWGLGRELYNTPKINIKCPDDYYYNDKLTMTFSVSEISFNEDGECTSLEVVDRKGNVVFSLRGGSKQVARQQANTDALPEENKELPWSARLADWCGRMKADNEDPELHTKLLAFYYYVINQSKRGEKWGVKGLWKFFCDDLRNGKIEIDASNPRHPKVNKLEE